MEYIYKANADGDSDNSNKRAIFSSIQRRLFYLYGDINAQNCADIAYDIVDINLEDDEQDRKEKDFKRKPIRLYINSFGGSVCDMWLLVDTILNSKTPVYTYCSGYTMSAAFQLFLSGHKRFISPHATLMYHQIYCWRSGKYQDLVDDREHMDHLNKQIESYVIEKTNITQEYLDSIREKKRDTYFTAAEALELGIADDMFENEQSCA